MRLGRVGKIGAAASVQVPASTDSRTRPLHARASLTAAMSHSPQPSAAPPMPTTSAVTATADAAQQPAATSVRVPSSAFSRRHFVGGAVGGMTAAVLTSPLEVVKTRLQIRNGIQAFGSARPTTFGVMRSICKTETVFGLWRGLTPTLIGVVPSRAIYFGSYSKFKESLSSHGLQGRVHNFMSAAAAGSLSATLMCPIWVVKTRLQLLPAHSEFTPPRQNVLSLGVSQSGRMMSTSRPAPQFSSIRHVATDMYLREGPRAFFRGLSASYWGISESAIQFAMYEECKQFIDEPTHLQLFLSAGACKLVAAALTYPHEVVRTRMREQRAPLGSKELKYRSMIQSLRTIFQEEGTRGLYGGLPAHLMRVVPNAAIMFLVVEIVANSGDSMSDVDTQVKQQVEFYFGDSNFRRDRFLKEETAKQPGGFIPFSVLFTFNKLAALTTDAEVLQRAIADSDVVEMNDAKDGLRRKHALPEKDDSADRTVVLAGLGQNQPTIEEIKAALAQFGSELLYISRRMYQKRFSGVVHVEFKDLEAAKRAEAEADKITIVNHKPSAIRMSAYQALSQEEQVEFEKSVKAMLVAKDVAPKPMPVYLDELLGIWKDDATLRARVKYAEETKTLYLVFTQVAFAEKVLEATKTSTPIVIDDKTLEFELVTDKDAIKNRPRKLKREDKKDNKRKRGEQGKAIHISQIGQRVRLDDIKKFLAGVMGATARPPYIEYDGLDTARFVINDAAAATALFEKLSALPEAELGGQPIKFHLLEPNEQLKVEVTYEKGLIVEFDGVSAEVSRDDIKNTINEKLGEKAADGKGVAFIKYQIGDKSGSLRMTSAALAQDVVAMITAEGGLDINGVKIEKARIVEGEEEKKFWEDAHSARSSRFKQARNNKRTRRN
ncbi:TPA: hypothetical protein N0F65_002853 [Lagenidium giganteum]|uniref:Uncharacterized protein n=1 Tax=Lagenidium giganteum TaxID=4803 RepID=A0AAV2ZBT9_9STRA|nr:TPA: hypothetical protein N0F65_002853 [Lagenidium giganteum]